MAMKLLIENSKIIATALKTYDGPNFFITAPDDFNVDWIDFYRYENNQLVVRCPDAVTMRQARLALLANGLLDQVNQSLANIADENQRKAAEIEWQYAIEVQRTAQLTLTLAAVLNLSDSDIDALFRQAALL